MIFLLLLKFFILYGLMIYITSNITTEYESRVHKNYKHYVMLTSLHFLFAIASFLYFSVLYLFFKHYYFILYYYLGIVQ